MTSPATPTNYLARGVRAAVTPSGGWTVVQVQQNRLNEEQAAIIHDYMKNRAYQQTIFIWGDKADNLGSHLHKQFVKHCGPKLTSKLAPGEDSVVFVNACWRCLWDKPMRKKEKKERKNYSQLMNDCRSNPYQMTHEKFLCELDGRSAFCEVTVVISVFGCWWLMHCICL